MQDSPLCIFIAAAWSIKERFRRPDIAEFVHAGRFVSGLALLVPFIARGANVDASGLIMALVGAAVMASAAHVYFKMASPRVAGQERRHFLGWPVGMVAVILSIPLLVSLVIEWLVFYPVLRHYDLLWPTGFRAWALFVTMSAAAIYVGQQQAGPALMQSWKLLTRDWLRVAVFRKFNDTTSAGNVRTLMLTLGGVGSVYTLKDRALESSRAGDPYIEEHLSDASSADDSTDADWERKVASMLRDVDIAVFVLRGEPSAALARELRMAIGTLGPARIVALVSRGATASTLDDLESRGIRTQLVREGGLLNGLRYRACVVLALARLSRS